MNKQIEKSEQNRLLDRFITMLKKKLTLKLSLYSGIKIFLTLTILLFAADLLTAPRSLQYNLFFQEFRDFWADFFNPVRYVNNLNPYFALDNTGSARISTPLHYLLFYLFHPLLGSCSTLKEMQQDRAAICCAISVMAATEVFLFFMLSKLCEKKNRYFLLLLLFSGINMFSVERGTLVIFTAGCIAGFLHYYQSEERKKQIFALTLLSLAAALKVYPALFGLLLLKKRDFKGILYCITLTSALGFLPLFFFKDGFNSLQYLFSNLQSYRVHYKLPPGAEALIQILRTSVPFSKPAQAVDWWLNIIDFLAIGTLIFSFINGKKEELSLAIASVMILCPVGAMPYTQLYIFPSFLFFVERIRQKHTKADIFTAAGYVLLLTPLQFSANINKTFVCTVLPLMLVVQLSKEICEIKKQRSQSVLNSQTYL